MSTQPTHASRFRTVSVLLVAASTACTGTIGTDGEPPVPVGSTGKQPGGDEMPLGSSLEGIQAACAAKHGALDVGLTRLQRMTRAQYDNTVKALVGVTGNPASAFGADEKVGPFDGNTLDLPDPLQIEQYQEVAKRLAADAAARMGEITGCDLAADDEDGCAEQFIESFGLKAYRRPLEEIEVDNYLALYALGRDNVDREHGFTLVVQAMLQSPFFLYHRALGDGTEPSMTPVAVTPYELASRLSYFLWNSMPDDELFTLAESGDLIEEGTLSAQVARLLDDERATQGIALFHEQWLGLEKLSTKEKDASLFPDYSPETVAAMLQETGMFADYVIRSGDGLMSTLFTANFGFPQGNLFDIYGVSRPDDFSPGMRVDFDSGQRAGILTQAAFLATNAHRNQTSPVHRGIKIRENVLCQTIEPPPNNVNTNPPAPTDASTTRDRFGQHLADPTCANCHRLMDPIGLGFENYDAIGAWRTEDGSGPVDATGEFVDVAGDLLGTFDGPLELTQKLAESQDVAMCMANQWFRFALKRVESQADACSMQSIHEGFRDSGGNLRELFAGIALSEAFRHARVQE